MTQQTLEDIFNNAILRLRKGQNDTETNDNYLKIGRAKITKTPRSTKE